MGRCNLEDLLLQLLFECLDLHLRVPVLLAVQRYLLVMLYLAGFPLLFLSDETLQFRVVYLHFFPFFLGLCVFAIEQFLVGFG